MPAPTVATRARSYNTGPLAGTDAALHIPQKLSAGSSTLPMTSTMSEVFLHMLEPLLVAQHRCLARVGKMYLPDSLLKYNVFKIGLGMARLRRVDDVWRPNGVVAVPRLRALMPRSEWYTLNRVLNVDVAGLLQACNRQWSSSWKTGTAVTGDETIVPHKGKRAGKLRQFVPRKTHSTGLKLYCMSDAVRPFIMDMYLFEGRRGVVRNATNDCVGKNTPTQMVQNWQALAPSESILVCDSYFGSANTAAYLTSAGQPFVLLAKHNDHGVGELGANLREGGEECAVASDLPFALHCFKNPKVGGKAARVVPMYTNCSVDPALWQHPRGHWLPPLVGAYRSLAAGVDQANALALHFREIQRFQTWSRALRAFVLRYGVVNTISTCKDLCLVPEETSLWDFQRMLLDDFFPEERFAKKEVHCIRATVKRGVCAYCKTGRVAWVCAACRVPLHTRCFAHYHGV